MLRSEQAFDARNLLKREKLCFPALEASLRAPIFAIGHASTARAATDENASPPRLATASGRVIQISC